MPGGSADRWAGRARRAAFPCLALVLLLASGTAEQPSAFAQSDDELLIVFASDPDGDSTVTPQDLTDPEQNAEIHVMRPDGSGIRQLTDSPFDDVSPAPSPDGSLIAFTSTRDGDEEIYLMARDGSGQVNLSNNPIEPDSGPSWSPDGARIAFGSARGGNLDIYVVNADGTSLARLTDDPASEFSPSWSPDGSRIAFRTDRDGMMGWSLYVMDADGSDERPLVPGLTGIDQAGWSRDGSRIAFHVEQEDGLPIFVANADGSGLERITDEPGHHVGPNWSPDGSRIVLAHTTGSAARGTLNFQVVLMDPDGSNRMQVTEGPASNVHPDWLPPLAPGATVRPPVVATATPAFEPFVPSARPAVRTSGGVVATETPQSGEAAASVLQRGGNAVDAAVAGVLAVGVTRPDLCGIGGGGFAMIRMAEGRTAMVDYRETAPAAITPDAYQGRGIFDQFAGHKTVGVPGTVAGLAEAHSRFGVEDWADLVAPAERLAREGFPVSELLAEQMARNEERLLLFPHSGRIYLVDGSRGHHPGEVLVQEDYADTLRLIAREGPDAFYRGEIARLIIEDMEENGGRHPGDESLMTGEDLAGYEPVWREPLVGTYRGYRILAPPPPTAGGIVLLEALNVLEGFDLGSMEFGSAEHLHVVAEATKLAWADREAYVADPAFADVPTESLVDKEYAADRRELIRADRALEYPPGLGGSSLPRPAAARPSTTSHVSVIDAQGNAAAFTCTIETFFGSAVVPEGAGFLLNNELTDFSPPGTPNEPEPGKRPRSSMTPFIVERDGRAVMVAGGAGGIWIPPAAIQVTSAVIDFGMDVGRAVAAPRVHEWFCCNLEIEDGRLPTETLDELRALGHQVVSVGDFNAYPWFQVVGTDLETGEHLGVSDPRAHWGTAVESPPRDPQRTVLLLFTALAALLVGAAFRARRSRRRASRAGDGVATRRP